MTIEWNKVTWYSKLVAVILFVLVFCTGFKLGEEKTMIKIDEVAAPSMEGTLHFTSLKNGLTFDYNKLFTATEGNQTPTTNWRVNTEQKGILQATVTIPRSYMPNTNFSEAKLTIGYSLDPKAIAECNIKTQNEVEENSETISGIFYGKFTSSDAGAGNFYETTSYRSGSSLNHICSVIEYTIHSTNIGNYSPDQGIKEFDKLKIQDELERTIRSLQYTKESTD